MRARKTAPALSPIPTPPIPVTVTRLIPVPEWGEHHAWPPVGGLRHLIFNAASNGFDRVVKRVGRRVLIDEAAFFEWVAEQNRAN